MRLWLLLAWVAAMALAQSNVTTTVPTTSVPSPVPSMTPSPSPSTKAPEPSPSPAPSPKTDAPKPSPSMSPSPSQATPQPPAPSTNAPAPSTSTPPASPTVSTSPPHTEPTPTAATTEPVNDATSTTPPTTKEPRSTNSTTTGDGASDSSSSTTIIAVGVSVGVIGLVALVGFLVFVQRRNGNGDDDDDVKESNRGYASTTYGRATYGRATYASGPAPPPTSSLVAPYLASSFKAPLPDVYDYPNDNVARPAPQRALERPTAESGHSVAMLESRVSHNWDSVGTDPMASDVGSNASDITGGYQGSEDRSSYSSLMQTARQLNNDSFLSAKSSDAADDERDPSISSDGFSDRDTVVYMGAV
ncbi:hypothetical protein SDRG_14648 [Saprolegnia diclina VS20]|uniref:Uncharacterized protein n=1 Tax=Saprolegnia diclina (strain VS20) TaxID=1156394 RepID=T0PQ43_SAPDV|nr:hypothetical protein SDRG_14648 [Saprolegnia diclina VS20]EQC27594.1 hypothetical protein SDRG_14648 [Saprolegnia diclina VS20]|eukprot:XP_008619014.1 hypothetical protein SDRG_14648 [Saprolegnia diclina VS20]